MGFDFNKNLFDSIDMRIEYDIVIPIEEIIINVNRDSIFNLISFSIIVSFEKNPDINGIPIKDILVKPSVVEVNGILNEFIPIIRISWYDDSWIMIPAHINIVDLNKAWIIKWINAILIALIEIANIIIAIWLRVDRAMIFFMSCSQFADILAYKVVDLAMNIKINIVNGWGIFMIRININTPAVTNVDEWTKAEIGVGAAIAIGSHAENGNCALFEQAASINIIIDSLGKFWFWLKFHDFIMNNNPIDIRIRISPIRLLNKVIDPHAAVL